MRIYKMTATFGKLEHAELTLEPGLNVINAPNEWGKSTWCAFLLAMLYGLDTRAKSTKNTLADKERYAPWSGSPMTGRIDLCWHGRDITIQRRTRGRIPLGEFSAFETATGLPVPELTGTNCGEMLLGAEQEVFRRAGFIRLSDMPVTQDEALRRRLNALVTTGDESGDGELLEKKLKELRNRCRYNRTGALPQAEAEQEALENKLAELDALETHSRKLKQRLSEEKDWLRQLENHAQALKYAAAETDADRVAQARDDCDKAEVVLAALEESCSKLPPKEEAEQKLRELKAFREQWDSVRMESRLLPDAPQPPQTPVRFQRMTTGEAREMVYRDSEKYGQLARMAPVLPFFLMAAALAVCAAVLFGLGKHLFGGVAAAAALALLAWGILKTGKRNRERQLLAEKYGSAEPGAWLTELEDYLAARKAYAAALAEHRGTRGELDARMAALETRRSSLCGQQSPEAVEQLWSQVLQRWEDYHAARREAQRTRGYWEALQAVVKPVKAPAMADSLTYTQSDTARLISDAAVEQQRLQNRLGQYQGRMEALGDRGELVRKLEQENSRIQKLEDMHAAAGLALDTLAQARRELQRRFAPRISRRAQELMAGMTAGRYGRLNLGEDLRISAGAGEEDILRDALWRSDGTVDQLYLALRLAVAEALTPQAPLVLDDALVRFDDERLKAALDILQEMAQTRQVILFTCQSREKIKITTMREGH